MILRVVPHTREQWSVYAKNAHLIVFGESMPVELCRHDYALLVVDEKETPVLYATVAEPDAKTAFLEYGGSFPDHRGSVVAYAAYLQILDWLKVEGKYDFVSFVVKNDNFPMLKFALKQKFKIIGASLGRDSLLLHHTLEFNKGE